MTSAKRRTKKPVSAAEQRRRFEETAKELGGEHFDKPQNEARMRSGPWRSLATSALALLIALPPMSGIAAEEAADSASSCESIYLAGLKEVIGEDWIKFISEIAAMSNKPV